jgi:hypothetical protein
MSQEYKGMKFLCIIAMIDMTFDFAEKAIGVTPQYIMSNDYIWVWWIGAACWATCTFSMFFVRVVK